ncbi:hypothetical protein ACFE04_000874 [Oxalis oulophora]
MTKSKLDDMLMVVSNRYRCNHQLWFTLTSSFIFCIILLCFDYSALYNSDNSFTLDVTNTNTNIKPLGNAIASSDTDYDISNPVKHQEDSVVIDTCLGRYVYIHHIPSRFNQDLISHCESITRGTDKDMCPYLKNQGFGPRIQDSDLVLLNNGWFTTNQFMLEVIFHSKMKSYECLTKDSSVASAVYVPFYAGIDMSLYLWGYNITVRDSSGINLMKWLVQQPEWGKMQGRDHFLVAGRISWDFRRQTDNESDWGSKLRFLPESNNMSMLSIEASSWKNDYAIPYPTCFHPSKEKDVSLWQKLMRVQKRKYLFSFAGAPRPEYQSSIRGNIIEECQSSTNLCKLLDCNYGAINCDNPVNVMRVFRDSVFCLQPVGDSYTRRSIFDAILAGCIPVFFNPGSAYSQYIWHLPKNHTKYSVYIPVESVDDWKAGIINKTLLEISDEKILALREEVINLIPRIVYVDSRSKLGTLEDAFDIAVKGILGRIEGVRSLIREGEDPSFGFADRDDYKFTFSHFEDGA